MNHQGCDRDAGERARSEPGRVHGQVARPRLIRTPSAPLHPVARPALRGHVFRRHMRPAGRFAPWA